LPKVYLGIDKAIPLMYTTRSSSNSAIQAWRY